MVILSQVISGEIFLVQSVSDNSAELPSEVLFKEFLDVHHRGIIFGAEPLTPLATLRPADVARVSSWCFFSSAVVLPKTIFEECLRQPDLKESAVGTYRQSFGRSKQCSSVNDIEHCYLLLPDAEHRVIERHYILLSGIYCLLLSYPIRSIHRD